MSRKPVTANLTTADARGDVVVLLIGMRVNHFWAVHQWLPVMLAMFRMLAELKKDADHGLLFRVLLTASPRTYYVVQYWESKEKLYAYATAPDAFHHAMWTRVNRMRRDGKTRGHVGIWHEAYVVPEGRYEAVYGDMPPFGLAAAHGQVPLDRRGRYARDRFAYRSGRAGASGAAEAPGNADMSGASGNIGAGDASGNTGAFGAVEASGNADACVRVDEKAG